MVSRTKEEDQANLKVHYPTVSFTAELDFGLPVGKKRSHSIAFPEKQLPITPVLFNPAAIKKHIKLLVLEDIGLAKIMEEQKAARLSQAGASAAGAKPTAGKLVANKGQASKATKPGSAAKSGSKASASSK
jgi:hypothetical protein